MHGRGQAEPGEHFATPRVWRVVLERGQDSEGRLLFQLLYDQWGGIGGLSAQLSKHIDEMTRQSLTAKQLGASMNAGGDKLRMARRVMAMV